MLTPVVAIVVCAGMLALDLVSHAPEWLPVSAAFVCGAWAAVALDVWFQRR